MPAPSYWPLVTAFGVNLLFVGLLLSPKVGPWGVIVAVAWLFFGLFKWWFEPSYTSIPGVRGKAISH